MKSKVELSRITNILFPVLLVVLSAFLIYTYIDGDPKIVQSRSEEGFEQIKPQSSNIIVMEDSPLGVATEHFFTIDESLVRDAHLAFYAVHQYVDVYIDGQNVYSLHPSEGSKIKTVGSNWVMIPIYNEDDGKEVRIVVTPVYESYLSYENKFLIGSGLNIYTHLLSKDMPQIVISSIAIVSGVFLIACSTYLYATKKTGFSLAALGLSVASVGIWRLFDMEFAPLIFPTKTVFLFTTALSMLMIAAIPLMLSLRKTKKNESAYIYNCFCIVAIIVFLVQLFLQVFGIADFRETLVISHVIILMAAVTIGGNMLYECRKKLSNTNISKRMSIISLIFIIGALTDLYIFYIEKNSSYLIFSLIAFVCYVVFAAVDFITVFSEKDRQLAEKDHQLIQSRITLMLSQIRSHFVFNVLNAISGMCKYDPALADKTIVHFARYLRTNIDVMNNDQPITFRSELRHVEDYMVLEQIRFGEKIRFETDLEEENFMIAPLILQPIIENSIKHGLTPKPDGGTIWLRTRRTDSHIRIEISDDGVGFDMNGPGSEQSVGLKNVKFRLDHLMNAEMFIESTPGQGTTVEIMIPVESTQS